MLRPVLTAILLASLAACQGGDSEPTAEATATVPATAAAVTPAPKANPDRFAESTPQVNASEPAASECGADKLARWVNVLPTSDVKDAIREAVGHDRIRYIEPGSVVTMDLRPDRLNVETGVDGRIKVFRCG